MKNKKYVFVHFFLIIKYFSFKKIINYCKIRISYILSVVKIITKYDFMPAFAAFEPSNFCNLRCPQCPVSMREKLNFKGEIMDFDFFKNIFNELKHNLLYTIFYFQGEPLLNNNLIKMIAFAHKNKVFTMISTNAQLLDNKTSRQLVESGLDKIIISIDGATQATYEQYRIGGSLERAIEGAKFIHKWKKELHSCTPLVEIQCLLLSTTENQIADMQLLAKNLNADNLVFKTAQFYDFENGNILMPKNEKFCRYRKISEGKYVIKNKLPNHCLRLWSGTVITADGKILPCCYDKNADFVFGKINKNEKINLKNIFNGKSSQNFRKNITENRKQFEICRNCEE